MTTYRNILIGNQYAAEEAVFLSVTGVTHLVNTAGTLKELDCVRPHPLHLQDVSISDYFDTTTAWMEEALQGGGKVLVNCWQGASR